MTVFMLSLSSDEYGLSGDSVLSESAAAAPRTMMANCDLKLEMEAASRRRRRGQGQGSRLLELLSRRSLAGGGAVGGARLVEAAGLLPRHPATVASHTHKARENSEPDKKYFLSLKIFAQVFCGLHCGPREDMFVTAGQDCVIRLYSRTRYSVQ